MGHQLGFNDPVRYHKLYRHFQEYYERLLTIILSTVPIGDGDILDLGCGIGDFTSILSKHLPKNRVIGVDVSPQYVEYAQRHHSGKMLTYYVTPAKSIFGLPWIEGVGAIFMKGSYHLFESELPIESFLDSRLRKLSSLIVIEKTERSLATYPAPKSAEVKRRNYVSSELTKKRLQLPVGVGMTSISLGSFISVPSDDYLNAVSNRQFSYLHMVPNSELNEWVERHCDMEPTVELFEENMVNIYYLK